jgi:hypothetical protein
MLEKVKKADAATHINISAPNFQTAQVKIVGTAPFVMNRMSSDNRIKMILKQEEGSRSKKGQKRDPKDFDRVYKGAMHISTEGWYGIPASSFRNALVSACRTVGFAMTRAKLSLFIIHDGVDAEDGQPLVKLVGEPVRKDLPVKLADGSTDIIPRPFFMEWSAVVTLRWDADQFSASDVINLLSRAGVQVGIGAGRPDSKNSCGMGWGTFEVQN